MSRFLSGRFAQLKAYVPGEQPQNKSYIKLNTNESPYPPAPAVVEALNNKEINDLRLYSDPECKLLRKALADYYKVTPENIVVGNGSDEILSFAFMAFCDKNIGVSYPDISYGFYPVFADLYGIAKNEIPLHGNFSINAADYFNAGSTIVIANPNAPTGVCLSIADVESIVKANPNNVVVIDEAYIDFGGESCIPLTAKYDNLLVVQTYSKSRSLAGARLGYAVGNSELIADLEKLRYSTNPYNVNRLTLLAGRAAIAAFRVDAGSYGRFDHRGDGTRHAEQRSRCVFVFLGRLLDKLLAVQGLFLGSNDPSRPHISPYLGPDLLFPLGHGPLFLHRCHTRASLLFFPVNRSKPHQNHIHKPSEPLPAVSYDKLPYSC